MRQHKDHPSKNKTTGALNVDDLSMVSSAATQEDVHIAKEDITMTSVSSHTSHAVKTYVGSQLVMLTMDWYVPNSSLGKLTTIASRKTTYMIRTNMHWWDNALRGGVML